MNVKAKEIRGFSEKEIAEKIGNTEQEIFNLHFQSRTNKLDNPLRLRSLRRDIARFQTVLGERKREAKTEKTEKKGS